MNNLQAVQLDILKEFSQIAERENLKWFAMFGTLLGAARNQCFIPDDDDIDIAMPRADYDRLRATPEMFHEPYFLQTPQNDPAATPRYIKLRRSDTTYITNYPSGYTRGGHMGIYIDVFPLDTVPDVVAAQRVQRAARIIHNQMLSSAAFDESASDDISDFDMSDFKEEYCYSHAGLPGHYGLFADLYEKMCTSFTKGHYYAIPVLTGERGTYVYDREWFDDSVEMMFEGLKIPVPRGWKEALLVSYPGGLHERRTIYRPIKQAEDRIIDTERSYKEYTRRYTDALKNIAGKKVYFFGAGDSFRIWLERFGQGLDVVCTFDNSPSKWGKTAYGVPVRCPDELPELLNDESRLIIASIYYKEIIEQLDNMGIKDYYVFIDGWDYRKDSE